jgi:hypothetical protein
VPPSPVALPAHAQTRLASNAAIAARNVQRAAQESVAPAPIPGSSTASIGDALGTATAEGQRLHAQRDLVRGGVARADVNPVAGYNTAVVAQRGEATRYADAARNAQLTAPAQGTRAPTLTNGDIVAGASKVRDGALVGWSGRGKRTRGQIQAALVSAGLPAAWAPEAKTARAQAGAIMAAINHDGFVARAVEADGQTREQRGWIAKWNIGGVDDLQTGKGVGDSFGSVAMVATLDRDERLTVDVGLNAHLASLAAQLRARYEARREAEEFAAGDVTAWLGQIMRERMAGIGYGPGSYYVRHERAIQAERLCTALKGQGWGGSWILPALPIATSQQLREGLVASLVDEARDVLVAYGEARDAAATSGKPISDKIALGLDERMKVVLERAQGFAALLGDAHVALLRSTVRAAIEEIAPTLSPEAIRFAGIWDDLRAEGAVSDAMPVATSDAIPEAISDVSAATVAVEAPAPSPVPVAVPVERVVINPTERGPRRPARSVTSTIASAPVVSSVPATMVDGVPLAIATERRTDASLDIRKGRLVRVVRGRKVPLGTEGVVLRADVGQWGPRVCIKTATGEIHWSSPNNVECVVDDNGRALYPAYPGTSAAQSA